MQITPQYPAASDPKAAELRSKIRACRRLSILFGLYFVLVGLPIAGNYGKGGPPILEPSAAWAPWIFALGTTGFFAGIAAVFFAVRVGALEDQLPRGLSKHKEHAP